MKKAGGNSAVCAVAVCWIGFSVDDKSQEDKETVVQETEMDTAALDEYLSSLNGQSRQKNKKNVDMIKKRDSVGGRNPFCYRLKSLIQLPITKL